MLLLYAFSLLGVISAVSLKYVASSVDLTSSDQHHFYAGENHEQRIKSDNRTLVQLSARLPGARGLFGELKLIGDWITLKSSAEGVFKVGYLPAKGKSIDWLISLNRPIDGGHNSQAKHSDGKRYVLYDSSGNHVKLQTGDQLIIISDRLDGGYGNVPGLIGDYVREGQSLLEAIGQISYLGNISSAWAVMRVIVDTKYEFARSQVEILRPLSPQPTVSLSRQTGTSLEIVSRLLGDMNGKMDGIRVRVYIGAGSTLKMKGKGGILLVHRDGQWSAVEGGRVTLDDQVQSVAVMLHAGKSKEEALKIAAHSNPVALSKKYAVVKIPLKHRR